MNELEKLYNALVAGGYYTKSFGEFQTQYNDPSYREKVFNVVSREGLYTKSREEFDVKYSPDSFPAEQEVITEEGVVETDQSMRPDLKKKDVTESVSADGSLESQISDEQAQFMQNLSGSGFETMSTEEIKQSFTPVTGPTDFDVEENPDRYVEIDGEYIDLRYFEIDGEYLDLLHPDGDKRRENLDRYQQFLNQQGEQEAKRLKEEAEAMTPKVIGYDKFTGRPIYESKGMPLIKFDAKEEKEKREAQKKKISKIKRFTEGDKEKYDSYNPLVNKSVTPLKASQQKGYLPANVELIPKAGDIVKLGFKPVVPFDREAYNRDKDLYAMMYDAEVETYKDYLKDKLGYIRASDGRYYNPENFNPTEIFNDKVNRVVNQELISREEEGVSMLLRDELSPFGFKVAETGTFTDRIIVTAPNGESQEFSLQNFFDDTDFNESVRLKAFLKRNYAKELTGGDIPKDIYGKEVNLLDIDVSAEQTADVIDKLTSYERRALDLDRERTVAGQGQLIYESDKNISKLNSQLEDTNKKIAEAEKLPESYNEWRGNVEVTVKNQQRADRLQFLNKKKSALEKEIDNAKSENKRLREDKPINPVYKELFSDNLDAQIQTDTEAFNDEARRNQYLSALYKKKEEAFLAAEKQALALAEQSFDKKTQKWDSEQAEKDFNTLVNTLANEGKALSQYAEKLSNDSVGLKIKQEKLKRDVGRKVAIQGEFGELGDALVSALVSGAGAVIEGGTEEFAGNIIRNINNMFYDETDEEYITDEEMNDFKKQSSIKKDWVDSYSSWADLTPEAMQAFRESLGVASMGFFGALESTPAMLLSFLPYGGKALAPLGFSFLSAQHLREQMDKNPEFDYMSENDKLKFIAPMAFLIGLLENYGFRNVMRNSSFIGKSASKLAGRGPTSKTLDEIGEDLSKNIFQREGRRFLMGGLAETETEGLQEALDIYGKEYMDLKMKNNFWDQDVRFFKDEKGDVNYFSKKATAQILESAAAGFFGGISMKAPSTIVSAVKGNSIQEIDDFTFMIYEAAMESPSVMNAQRAQINNDIASGKLTKEQGDEKWNNYTRVVGQMREVNKVAGQYDTNTKKKLLSLLMEKKQLEEKIDGVDKSLTREEQRKIKVAEERIQETLASGETKLTEDKAAYEQAKKDGYKGTFEQHRNGVKIKEVAEQAVEQEVKKKKPVKKAPVVEETTVTEEAAPVVEQTATQQEALETQPITKITNDLVTKEKKGELTQEETDGILLGIMEKIEAENAKRKSPLSPEQAQKKLGKMQQRVFEANKDRYLELSGVMPAAQEQFVEEATVVEEAAPVVEEAPKRNAKVFDYDNLSEQPLSVLEEKLEEAEIDTQEKDQRRRDIAKDKVRALKAEIKIAKEQLAKEKAPVKKAPKKTTKKKAPVKEEPQVSEEVQKEIDRAERLRDGIVAEKANKLSRAKGFEQKEEIRDEIRQTEKKYNNIITELKEGKRAQFQLEAETTSEQTKQKLLEIAENLVEDVTQENDGDISESPWTAEQPAPGAEIITIEVKENSELAKKVRKMGLDELVGKKISLVMADQLKVDKKRMGGPFFPLMDKLFGKVAWASIDKGAASGIINGAINSDYSVVYNMNPSAIDSNSIMGETLVELLENLPKSERQEVFELMKENVLSSKAKDFVRIKEVFEKSKTLPQALKGLQKLGVDERAALLKKVVPSRDVTAKTPIGAKLQENNITIEGLREINVEQFVSELPAGAMTMVLEVTDKAGNKITKETKDEAFITPEQQKEEGLPQHPNYPIYIRGRAVAMLKETTPFYNMLKDLARNIEVKVAGIVRQKSGRKITSKEAVSNEMRAASMAASRARTVQAPQASRYQQFVSVLRRSFPSVEVVTTQAEFDTLLKETGAKQLTTKNQKVYGAVYQGKLYLNPSLENYNTPVHEFGHVWMNVAKEANPKLYKKGLSLIKGSQYEQDVLNNKAYQKVIKQMKKDGASEQEIEQYILEEALATAIGDKGESFVKASQKKNFKQWLETLYGFVRKLTGISKYSAKQLEDITLDEFTQAVAVDLLSGRQLFEGAEITDMGDALQLMAEKGVDLDAAMNEAINDMIDKGFKAAEIKGVLLKKGYKARAINDALIVKIDADMKLPNEFANIEGGVKEGEALFRSVMEKLKEFAAPKLIKGNIKEQYNEAKKDGYKGTLKEYTEEQNNKKVEMLKQANSLLVFFTNEEILKRYPNIQNEVVEKQQKSRAEIRAKAIELLKAEPTFQAQDALMQKELVVSMDKVQKSRSNKEVQKKITSIKQALQGAKEATKSLQGAKNRVKNLIKEELIPFGVSVRQANKLVSIIQASTQSTYQSDVIKVMKVVEAQIEKKKTETVEKMLKLAKKKASVKNKRARTDVDAARFFKQATVVLEALKSKDNTDLKTIESKLIEKEERIYEILDDINDGLEVNEEDRNLASLAQAFDILGSLKNQDLAQHEEAFNLMKSELESGMESLRTKRAARKAVYDKLRAEADKDIKAGYDFLFDEEGQALSTSELENLSDEVQQEMWDNITSIPKLLNAVNNYIKLQAQNFGKFSAFTESVKNLGTLLRGLDRKGKFFEKNVFDKLNRMEEDYLQGYFNTMDMLESELNSIGIKGGIDGLNKIINKEFVIAKTLNLKGIKLDLKKGARPVVKLTKGEAMRIYALSKNADQMNRLKAQGFNEAKMQKIEEFIGPQLVKAVDITVDFLSTSYFEGINKVYEDVNDVSLPYIENYFPTKTVPSKSSDAAEFDRLSKEMKSGNFAGVFSAQQASALKERTSKDAVDIKYQDFSSTLEEHIRTMERFKAYAMGTKEINIIINHTPSVKALLQVTNLQKTISDRIMAAINPNAAQQLFESSKGGKAFTFFQRQYTGITLALKPIQALKQMSSFINAWEDYSLRGQEKRIPIVDTVLDALGFSYDIAATFFLLPKVWGKYSTYNKAMYSASFKDRIRQSFKTADLLGLEAGVGARRRSKKTRLGRALRRAKVVANSPTLVGDIAGVMGYMAAYRANIRNGMSQKEAIEKFNAYNETQQTRRGTDKIGLQTNSNMYTRVFTMFGSSLFLQLNKVMQSVTKLRRASVASFESAVKGDWKGTKENFPKEKDVRALYVNLFIANIFFAAMANIFKYHPLMDDDDDELTEEEMERTKKAKNKLKKDKKISDEDLKLIERYQFMLDKKEVFKAYENSIYGMNQLFNLPLVGPSIQQNWDYYYWNNPNAFTTDKKSRVVNPLEQTFTKGFWDKTLNDVSESEFLLKTIISFALGVDVKRPIAMIERLQSFWGGDEMYREEYEELKDEKKFKGTFDEYKQQKMEENMYELMGISYSYRPGSGRDWTKKKMTITVEPKKEEEPSKGFEGKQFGGKSNTLVGGEKIGG